MHSKKLNQKSQAAMEFLMTYGWAILIVLIVLAALYLFGVFTPGSSLSSTCVAESPFISCESRIIEGTGNNPLIGDVNANNTLVLRYPNYLKGVKINGQWAIGGITCNPIVIGSESIAVNGVPSDKAVRFSCSSSPGQKGTRYSGTINIVYTSLQGITRTSLLKISGTIE